MAGFATQISRYVDDKLTVIVLTNLANARPQTIAKGVAGLYNAELGPLQRTAIPMDPKVFDVYVGEYELTPEFVIKVFREGDRFWAQATGQPRLELFAESETSFFLKDVDAQITFARDAGGKPAHLVLHQNGAQQEAKKVR